MQSITTYIKLLFTCTPLKSSNLLSAQFVWKILLSFQLSNSSKYCILQYKYNHLLCSVMKKSLMLLEFKYCTPRIYVLHIYLKIAFKMYAFKQ